MTIASHLITVVLLLTSTLLAAQSRGTAHEQEQFVPYWTLEAGWHSELQLRNNLQARNLEVTPILRLSDGTEYILPTVTIPGDEVRTLDLDQALVISAPGLASKTGAFGSLVVRYLSVSQRNLTASIMIHFDGRPIDFHLDATSPAPVPIGLMGSHNGVWWMPFPNVSQYFVLSNYSTSAAKVELVLFSDDGIEQKKVNIPLLPRQTVKLDLSDLLRIASVSGTLGGLQLRYIDGSQVYPVQFAYEETRGFSALMKLHRRYPGDKPSALTLRAAMIALSNPDPALKFPEGTVLIPQIFIRNTLYQPIPVEVIATWRSPSASGTTSLGVQQLKPQETKLLDLSGSLGQPPMPPEANWAGLALRFFGREGDVLALSNSYDSTWQHGLQSPFSAQLAGLWMGGVWYAGAHTNSLITVGNGGSKATVARIRLNYEGGSYEVTKPLTPNEQVWVNVEELRRSQTPDAKGSVIAVSATSGTYQVEDVNDPVVGSLFEGKLVIDKTFGHASYGCLACCNTAFAWIVPDPLNLVAGSGGGVALWGQDDCGGLAFNRTGQSYNWGSSNNSVATVAAAFVNSVGAGSATITGSYSARLQDYDRCSMQDVEGFGTVRVSPKINSISPSQGLSRSSVAVTINGLGFGGSATVNAPSGVTVTIQSRTDTQIKATFNVGSTAPGGNALVSVAAGGQMSNTVNFYVLLPHHLRVVSDSYVSLCAGVLKRSLTVGVVDANNVNVGVVPVNEVYTSVSQNTCGNGQPIPTSQCLPTDGGTNQFTDQISVNACSVIPLPSPSCGYNITHYWQWCPSSGLPVKLGTLSDTVHADSITVNGVTSPPNQIPSNTNILP